MAISISSFLVPLGLCIQDCVPLNREIGSHLGLCSFYCKVTLQRDAVCAQCFQPHLDVPLSQHRVELPLTFVIYSHFSLSNWER